MFQFNHEFHEFSSMFPLMEGAEFEELVADIAANGQHEMIVMLDNKVLDGRNRYLACKNLGITPRLRDHNCADGEAIAYVWSANAHRRQLSAGQKAIAVVKREKLLEHGGNRQGPRRQSASCSISIGEAAKIANTSPRSIDRAKVIVERGTPEEIAAVESGKASLHSVAEKIAQKGRRRTGAEIERDAFIRLMDHLEFWSQLDEFDPSDSVLALLTKEQYTNAIKSLEAMKAKCADTAKRLRLKDRDAE
jgi:hypothetical protein